MQITYQYHIKYTGEAIMRLTIIGILVLLSILITGCASGSPAGTSSPAAVVVEEHDHSV
jgi:hypothetical protein